MFLALFYIYADFRFLPIKEGDTGNDMYHVQQLAGFWVTALGMLLVLASGIGLLLAPAETLSPPDVEPVQQ